VGVTVPAGALVKTTSVCCVLSVVGLMVTTTVPVARSVET
jgi:hypothetical protein